MNNHKMNVKQEKGQMKPIKIGDRVKVVTSGMKGTVIAETPALSGELYFLVSVNPCASSNSWHPEKNLTRLVKKKKVLSKKECERIIESATDSLTKIDAPEWKTHVVTVHRTGPMKLFINGTATVNKSDLAAAWNKFVWGMNHTHASESILFEAFCKHIGFNKGEK